MKSTFLGVLATVLLTATGSHALTNPPSNDRAVAKSLTTGTSASCTTGVQAALISTQGSASAGLVVTGTFVGTLTFKGAVDEKVTFNTVNAYPQAGGAPVTTATSTGTWLVKAAGYRWLCVYFSAYTSGTAAIFMTASAAPVSSFTGADIATIASSAIALGSTTGSASLPVVIASDQGSFTVKAAGAAADDAAISGAPVPIGLKAVADAAQPSAVQAGDVAYHIGTLERIPIVTTTHPNHFQCNVAVSTATTLTAVGAPCAAPGAGLSLYITDVSFGSSAASSTAADAFPTLKSGTGGTCGVATAVIWSAMTAANVTQTENFSSPIKVTANSEICWIHSVAGSKVLHIQGYIAP